MYGIPAYEFKTNCDSSGFSSGGSLLTVGENPKLLGIHFGSTETKEAGAAAMKSGIPNRCAYNDYECHSNYVPLNGRFYDALMQAAK